MIDLDAAEYKCPNCNAELKFDPTTQKLSCDYCLSSFTIDEIKEIYAESVAVMPDEAEETEDEFASHTSLYHCASCGADIMADEHTTALFCYYCHNPVILSGKLTGDYKPSKIIGFKITREQALSKFKHWCSGRMFVPKDFNSDEQLEKMTGLYVPFWVANCDLKADYAAVGRRVRSWTTGSTEYTETKEYSVVRSANIIAEGIPADGESKIDDLLMESIEPFNYSELKDFSMSYFSGFFADKYDVDKAAVFPRIRSRATDAGRSIIRKSVSGYTSLKVMNETYSIKKTDWQYIMLPVWFMTYRYNGKVYEFALNGQTGKLAGTPPLNKMKLNLVCAAIGLGITILGYLLGVIFL
ncbi:MAG TPA: hypothetical protein P5092_06880 [Ruminococcus sp.]|nr:hypothetical protein [Ruminococcus sp.]